MKFLSSLGLGAFASITGTMNLKEMPTSLFVKSSTNGTTNVADPAVANIIKAFSAIEAFTLDENSSEAANLNWAFTIVNVNNSNPRPMANQFASLKTLDLSAATKATGASGTIGFASRWSVVKANESAPYPNLTTLALPYNAFKVSSTAGGNPDVTQSPTTKRTYRNN